MGSPAQCPVLPHRRHWERAFSSAKCLTRSCTLSCVRKMCFPLPLPLSLPLKPLVFPCGCQWPCNPRKAVGQLLQDHPALQLVSHHGHTRPWRPRQLRCYHLRHSPTQWAVLIHRCGPCTHVHRSVLRAHLLRDTPLAHARSPHWLLINARAFATLWIVLSSGGSWDWICTVVQGIWNPSNEFFHGAQARWLHSHRTYDSWRQF